MKATLLTLIAITFLAGCNAHRQAGFSTGLQRGAVTGHNLVQPYAPIPYPPPRSAGYGYGNVYSQQYYYPHESVYECRRNGTC